MLSGIVLMRSKESWYKKTGDGIFINCLGLYGLREGYYEYPDNVTSSTVALVVAIGGSHFPVVGLLFPGIEFISISF